MKPTKWTKNPPYTIPPTVNAPTVKTPPSLPTPDAIRQRAQQIFLARGNTPDSELMDWLMAERELRAEFAKSPKK